jgi:molybdopterin-guanine dinucleotide biosynthesis protein A
LQSGDHDAVVARTSDGWQPLCAAYRRTCLPKIVRALDEGRAAVVDVLPDLRVDVVPAPELQVAGLTEAIFQNVNDPRAWRRALRRSRNTSQRR